MTLKLFSLTLNFCAFASTVRCSFYRGANCSAFRVGNERVRLPINHAFSGAWCAPKQMRAIAVELLAAHLPWGRLPEYTHTHTQLEILQAHWKCRGGRGHAWTGLSVNTTWHDFHKVSGFSWHLTPQRCMHLLVYEPVFPLECGPTPRWGSIYFWFSEFKKRALYKIQNLKKDLHFIHYAGSTREPYNELEFKIVVLRASTMLLGLF